MIIIDVLKTCLHLALLIKCEVFAVDLNLSYINRAVVIISSKIGCSTICVLNLAIIDVVPAGLIIIANVLGTIHLVPAISSGTILYYIVIHHLVDCRITCSCT